MALRDASASKNLLPPDSDSDGSEGEEQSTGMQSKKVPSSPANAFSFSFSFFFQSFLSFAQMLGRIKDLHVVTRKAARKER